MHVEFRLLNVEHVCAFEAHSYQLVEKLCALQPDSISQTGPFTSSEHSDISPLHRKEERQKQHLQSNVFNQEQADEKVQKMIEKSATRVSKSTCLCSNDMAQASTEIANNSKEENLLNDAINSTLHELNKIPQHDKYVHNSQMTENMYNERGNNAKSNTRTQSLSRKEYINEDAYKPVIRIQFIFENAIKIESSNLSLKQYRSKLQCNTRKRTSFHIKSVNSSSNNDSTNNLYSAKYSNSTNSGSSYSQSIKSEHNILDRNIICTRSCQGKINEVLLASLPMGFLSLPIKIRILQLQPNDKCKSPSHNHTNGISNSNVSGSNEANLVNESTLCIGVAKVNFGKVAKTPGSVCVVLQPKANIVKMVNEENTRWQTRLRSLTDSMMSEEASLSSAVTSESTNVHTQFCSLITSGNGSAQLTFQIIVYSFAKIPRHRLLLCDRKQCTQRAPEEYRKELNYHHASLNNNDNDNDNGDGDGDREHFKSNNFTVQNTKWAVSKRVLESHELHRPTNDLSASAGKSPSPERANNNNNNTMMREDSSGSNSLPLLMFLESNSSRLTSTTHSRSNSISSLSNTLNALTNNVNNSTNSGSGTELNDNIDNNIVNKDDYTNNHVNTIRGKKDKFVNETVLQSSMEAEFRSPAVRFALVPYIALIHIILTNHHLLMWHRPVKTLLFIMILLFTLIADIFDTGVVLFLCAELLFLLRITFLFYRIRRAETSRTRGLVSSSDESSHGSVVYLYGRQHSLLNAMVRARLFFLRGLQEDCFYELIFVFHIIYHQRSTLLRLSVALLCVKLCFSLETLFILTLLATITCYPVYIRLSSPWVAETRHKRQGQIESNQTTTSELSQPTSLSSSSSLSFLPRSASRTTNTLAAFKSVLGLATSSSSPLSSPYTEPSTLSDRRTEYLRDKSKWHLWRMQWKSNAPLRVVRVVQVSVKAQPPPLPQTTQHVRRSYEAGLRDGLKYAALQYKNSLSSTQSERFMSTHTISKTPVRSAHDAAATPLSPSPNPLVSEKVQVNNDNTNANITTMYNNNNINNYVKSGNHRNEVGKAFIAIRDNDYRQENNALLHKYDSATETGKINNKSGMDGKITNRISPVHTPTIPLVPKENAVFSASVRDAGNDWRKRNNSYAPVNNVTSPQTDKLYNEAHKRVQSWNVMDRWSRSLGNYNELKSFDNPLEGTSSAKRTLNMNENKAKISIERLEGLGHIRQVSATFNAPLKLYSNEYSTSNNVNNSNTVSGGGGGGVSRANTNMTGMSITRHSALSFAVVVFTLNHLHDDTLSSSFALSNEVANRQCSVACSSSTPANKCDIYEEHNTFATEARTANRRSRAFSSLLVRLEKHNKALHHLQQCVLNSTSNNIKSSNLNYTISNEQSTKEKSTINNNYEEHQAFQSYFKETLSFLTYLRRMWNPHAYLAVSLNSFMLSRESTTGVTDRIEKVEGKAVKLNDRYTNIVEANNKLEIDANSNVNDRFNEDEHTWHSALTKSNHENELCKNIDEEKQNVNYFVRREWLAAGNKVDGLSSAVFAMPNNTFSLVKVPGVHGCDREARTMALLAAHLLQGNSFTLFTPPSATVEEEHLPTRLFAVNNTDHTNNVPTTNLKMLHSTTFSNTFHNTTASLSADLTASTHHSINPATLIGLVSGSDYIARMKTPNPCPQQLLDVLEKIWRGEATLPSLHPRTLINADLVLQIINLHKEGKLGYSATNRESDENAKLFSKNNNGANWNVFHAEYVDHDKSPLITVLKIDDKVTNSNVIN